ncbi:MAG TPA: TetR/AcrR family transcriptional regulator [Clostridia bacterium]|nr:TetR/AcrR family transcriptional regulator [Clostridia bacterium]
MPKGFTEREKEIIRNKLLEKGREFLTTYGVRKTCVEDLARAAGISKGAFYIFYGSKEELFFEIFEQVEAEVKQKVVTNIFDFTKPPKESFKEYISNLILTTDENPMWSVITNKGNIDYLLRKLPPEIVQKHLCNDVSNVADMYANFKEAGFLKDHDPEVVSGILRALFCMIFHKDDIGGDVYEKVIKAYVGMTADYLIR